MVNNTNLLNVDSVESLGQKKVLVIDDFANVRKSIKGMLSSIGVSQIVEAATAARAVLAIKDNSFDIVICDYNLGPGRDGQQLLEEVRANNILSYRTVYVMVTAETSRDMVMGAIEFQPDDYLAKPFAFETLKQRVYRWIDRQNKLDRLLGAMDTQNDEKILLESEKVMSGDSRFRSFAQKKAVETMVRLGKSPEARALINQINQKRQQGWTQIELANILVQEKQDLKAIEVLKKALIQEPNLLAGYDLMASCYQRIGDQQSAQDSLKKGVVRSPRNIARQKQLGDVSLELDDIETAAKCYKYVVSLSDETMHENEENHESLIRSIKDLYDQSKDSKEQRRLLADANKFLKDLSNKFQDSESANLFSKVFQYKFAKVDKDKSDKVDGFLKETLAVIESISVELGVDVAQILYEEDRYQDAQQFGHHIHPTRASLVPLTWNSKDKLRFENLSGMALSAKVQMHQQSFEHKILFTHRGLSGPSILQISNYWQPGNHINIDFLPSNNISSLIEQALQENSKQTLKQLIKGLWPARWIDSWFSCELLNKQLAQLSKQNMSTLEQMIHHWVFSPGGDEGYRTAEVTIGGVDCNEVSSKTMQSQLQSGLFFAGEVLDVTGHLGGFNFQWAWSSGFVAGAHC